MNVVTPSERRIEDFRQAHRAMPGLYLLAVHSSLAAAVNAELLHHLRDNFLLERDPARRIPVTPEGEVALARLLLSPLYRELGDGLWEMDPDVRTRLLGELAVLDGGQRLHDVAALLERYTREESPWQEWPELREAQLVSAWDQLDPQAVDEWLAAGRSASGGAGLGPQWFAAMRRRLDEARAAPAASADAPLLDAQRAVSRFGPTVVLVRTEAGFATAIRLTTSGVLATTAGFVLDLHSQIRIVTVGSTLGVTASILGVDTTRDVGFIRHASSELLPVAVLGAGLPVAVGNAVIVVGHRAAGTLEAVETTVIAIQGSLRSRTSRIVVGAGLGPGSSGGLLVSTQPGQGVLGMHLLDLANGEAMFVPAEAILEALDATLRPGTDSRIPPGSSSVDGELCEQVAQALVSADRASAAVAWYREAIAVYRGTGVSPARAMGALAVTLVALGQLAEARVEVAEAIRLVRMTPTATDRARLLAELIDVARVVGEDVEPLMAEIGVASATTLPPALTELADRYDTIRVVMSSGPARTAAMTEVVEDMRMLPVPPELVAVLAAHDAAGRRLAAIVALQDAPDPEWLAWLGERLDLDVEKPFVGYQAAVALRNAAEHVAPEHLELVAAAIGRAQIGVTLQPGSDRARLLERAAKIAVERLALTAGRSRAGDDRIKATLKLWDNGQTVRVAFLDGPPELHRRVAALARQWVAGVNLRLEFLPFPSTAESDIRITFGGQGTWWSYLGTDARIVPPGDPTMCITAEYAGKDNEWFRRAVLMQFGHALGLINEHQNPNADIPWDRDVVYRTFAGPPNHWTREEVDQNVLRRYSIPGYREFDPESVMLHAFAPKLVSGRKIGGGSTLSRSDRAFVARLYPLPTARPT